MFMNLHICLYLSVYSTTCLTVMSFVLTKSLKKETLLLFVSPAARWALLAADNKVAIMRQPYIASECTCVYIHIYVKSKSAKQACVIMKSCTRRPSQTSYMGLKNSILVQSLLIDKALLLALHLLNRLFEKINALASFQWMALNTLSVEGHWAPFAK